MALIAHLEPDQRFCDVEDDYMHVIIPGSDGKEWCFHENPLWKAFGIGPRGVSWNVS